MIKHSICLITTFCKNNDSDGVAQVLREMVQKISSSKERPICETVVPGDGSKNDFNPRKQFLFVQCNKKLILHEYNIIDIKNIYIIDITRHKAIVVRVYVTTTNESEGKLHSKNILLFLGQN